MSDERVKKLVAVKLSDKTACVVMICYICRIFGENVSDNLADWIIAFAFKCVVNFGQDELNLVIMILF